MDFLLSLSTFCHGLASIHLIIFKFRILKPFSPATGNKNSNLHLDTYRHSIGPHFQYTCSNFTQNMYLPFFSAQNNQVLTLHTTLFQTDLLSTLKKYRVFTKIHLFFRKSIFATSTTTNSYHHPMLQLSKSPLSRAHPSIQNPVQHLTGGDYYSRTSRKRFKS